MDVLQTLGGMALWVLSGVGIGLFILGALIGHFLTVAVNAKPFDRLKEENERMRFELAELRARERIREEEREGVRS